MKLIFALLGSSLLLAGCSDPKAVSKSNFAHAIDEWIKKSPPCLRIPSGTVRAPGQDYDVLPQYVEVGPTKSTFGEDLRKSRIAPLEALVDAGLMKATRTEIAKAQYFGAPDGKIPVMAYDLTDKGKAAFKKDEAGASRRGMVSGFCYGKPTVDEVTQFTQPGDMMGMQVSQVSYKYHLADLPDWAKTAKMKAAFPDLARDTAGSLEDKTAVVLTNEGWKHQQAI